MTIFVTSRNIGIARFRKLERMKTEELIKELKLSIHEGINALDPLAKELLREYKMQQLVYAVISGILTIISVS